MLKLQASNGKIDLKANNGSIAFGKDVEPYIEITEQERKQPLPNKYSWYAVENGKFVIKSREPSAEEKAADEAEAKRKAEYVSPEQRIKELENALDALLSGRVE